MPACNFWKNAVVISGNSLTFVVLTNKNDYGRARIDHFALFTGACPLFAAFSAKEILVI
ncbi:hypothetical protein [Ignatzschineria cameli]|uniref:hypothetical protein n=1 Tax=Ignatzschineria cameli TaxID=2182793 RepID=UPI0013004FF2|nr:hypothetical protein [Ignatzschineria cameli]